MMICRIRRMGYCVDSMDIYMTVHQQDSSQPQHSHDSPHLGAGEGLMMVETEEATLAGILKVVGWWVAGGYVKTWH